MSDINPFTSCKCIYSYKTLKTVKDVGMAHQKVCKQGRMI